ncbi:hypothetical protein B0T24DRAFT_725501 [Lasiosphaeria ovina]|uniref:Uncharacterized protein n=1 Tax=Lasiosphaeria ovina TaxID=92902 RepID=A0AAE0MXX5_9PEZI|nr:hypothetical protein B0T24DRAFT_725501 [Lasiosphaeria ovina]
MSEWLERHWQWRRQRRRWCTTVVQGRRRIKRRRPKSVWTSETKVLILQVLCDCDDPGLEKMYFDKAAYERAALVENMGYLNQRVFADIGDLAPYGFADIVRSVVCPSDDVCVGIEMDKDLSPETNFPMGLFWVDIRYIPARKGLGP